MILGETPFSQTQLYVRVSASQSLASVLIEVTPGCCRQMSGHWDRWFRHQASMDCQHLDR